MMKTTMSVAISAAALFLTACGGSEAVPSRTGTTTQALADDCTTLRETIDKLREVVKSCNPAGSMLQCRLVLDDVCCPISASGGPVEEFQKAVATYKDQCKYFCPMVACQDPSHGMCGLDGQCHP
ncbi:MAG: hypothetical protein IRZ16_04570 [Myxococcaceae bacterium]|nr:hypothetical protein [Myxococcaceae bacterium]